MEASPHASDARRRHHSELDMTSLRRISEALLLAQNRARLATERANRCERVLRMVLTQVNPQLARSARLELDGSSGGSSLLGGDSIADWDLVAPPTSPPLEALAVGPPSLFALDGVSDDDGALSPHRRHSFDVREVGASRDEADGDGDALLWASMVAPERNVDVALLAKEIVDNLRAAAARSDQRVQKLSASMPSGATFVAGGRRSVAGPSRAKGRGATAAVAGAAVAAAAVEPNGNWLETWKHRLFRTELYALTPAQFVAGILVGVVVGIAAARQLALRRADGGGTSQLMRRLATYSPRRSGQPASTLRYFPFAVEDAMSSYCVYPAAVEVA